MPGSGPAYGRSFDLDLLPGAHALVRLEPGAPEPGWLAGADPGAGLVSVTRTPEELSIICPERLVPGAQERSGDRRVLRVAGPLEHSLTGVLVAIAAPLAEAGVPILAFGTWDTDWLLVAGPDLDRATAALSGAGHRVARPAG